MQNLSFYLAKMLCASPPLMESDHYVEHNGAAHPLMVSMSHPKYKESILLCISFSYDYTKT